MIYKPILKLHIITFERIVQATDKEDANQFFAPSSSLEKATKDCRISVSLSLGMKREVKKPRPTIVRFLRY